MPSMRTIFLLTLPLFFTSAAFAVPVIVGIYQTSSFEEIKVEITSGAYQLKGAAEPLALSSQQTVNVVVNGSGWIIKLGERRISGQGSLIFQGEGLFRIVPEGHKPTGRIFPGELVVRSQGNKLVLLNRLDIEEYVPGVIEAEAGPNHTLEYYKVQAIISRTYALNNLKRHEAEGFNICDQVHCQVYHGKPRFVKEAVTATKETFDIVIVDDDINLITAAFHSNCGGHTVNAEDVWSKPLSYCVGRRDTFCLVMPHSNWEKTIPAEQWRSYLESKRFPGEDTLAIAATAYFPASKEVYFVHERTHIPLRTIRSDFKLKSAFFTVHQDGSQVRLIGQGFGHGVGLCQEGAMRMAQLGYSYKEIIAYYYLGVHLIPRRFIWFFKED